MADHQTGEPDSATPTHPRLPHFRTENILPQKPNTYEAAQYKHKRHSVSLCLPIDRGNTLRILLVSSKVERKINGFRILAIPGL
jgi:hypothetical protein